jgi:hypothetical protein
MSAHQGHSCAARRHKTATAQRPAHSRAGFPWRGIVASLPSLSLLSLLLRVSRSAAAASPSASLCDGRTVGKGRGTLWPSPRLPDEETAPSVACCLGRRVRRAQRWQRAEREQGALGERAPVWSIVGRIGATVPSLGPSELAGFLSPLKSVAATEKQARRKVCV